MKMGKEIDFTFKHLFQSTNFHLIRSALFFPVCDELLIT